MAVPTNTVRRQDQNNVREQLLNEILQTEPEDTPVTSSLGTYKLTNTKGEYMRKALRAPNADNAALDGDDAVASAGHAKQRLQTEPQIFTETASVSGRAREANTAGYADEFAEEISDKMLEIKRDLEAMILSQNVGVVESGTTPSKSPGLGVHLYTNALHNGAGATAAHTAGLPTTAVTAGTNRAFTAGLLESAMQGTYTASGKTPKLAVVSPFHKVQFSKFDGLAAVRDTTSHARSEQSFVQAGADVYISNFGKLVVMPHYMMAGKNYCYLLDPASNKIGYFRGMRQKELGATGDSDRVQIILDAGLCVRSEKNQAKIADLTPA